MNYLEFELAKARYINSQCWTFVIFTVGAILNLSVINLGKYWRAIPLLLFYLFLYIITIVFVCSALHQSYKIKKLEKEYCKKLKLGKYDSTND